MTSAVARVDFHWFSFLLRKSHCTRPWRRASDGSSSMSVRSANACVSIVSLYQSQERSSGAQYVPRSRSVFAESITLAQTSVASFGRPERFSVSASRPFMYGECCFQCLKEKARIDARSAGVSASPIQDGSG